VYLDMPNRAATLYDSMGPPRETAPARQVAKDFVELVGPSEFSDWSSWSFQESPCPQQDNEIDCGTYALVAALHVTLRLPVPNCIYPPAWRAFFAALARGKPLREVIPKEWWNFVPVVHSPHASNESSTTAAPGHVDSPSSLFQDTTRAAECLGNMHAQRQLHVETLAQELADGVSLVMQSWLRAGHDALSQLKQTLSSLEKTEARLDKSVKDTNNSLYLSTTRESLKTASSVAKSELGELRHHYRRRLGWVKKSLASLEAASDLLEIVKDIQQASKLYQENQESTRASSIAEAE